MLTKIAYMNYKKLRGTKMQELNERIKELGRVKDHINHISVQLLTQFEDHYGNACRVFGIDLDLSKDPKRSLILNYTGKFVLSDTVVHEQLTTLSDQGNLLTFAELDAMVMQLADERIHKYRVILAGLQNLQSEINQNLTQKHDAVLSPGMPSFRSKLAVVKECMEDRINSVIITFHQRTFTKGSSLKLAGITLAWLVKNGSTYMIAGIDDNSRPELKVELLKGVVSADTDQNHYHFLIVGAGTELRVSGLTKELTDLLSITQYDDRGYRVTVRAVTEE